MVNRIPMVMGNVLTEGMGKVLDIYNQSTKIAKIENKYNIKGIK